MWRQTLGVGIPRSHRFAGSRPLRFAKGAATDGFAFILGSRFRGNDGSFAMVSTAGYGAGTGFPRL